MKLRIAAAAAVGIMLIGILGRPLAAQDEPFAAVSLAAGSMNLGAATILLLLAVLVGFIGYFVSWPYGREIGILAVPFGLAVWAIRTGNMAGLTQLNPTLPQRQQLFAILKWEPIFWLAVVAAGFAGVLAAQKISQRKARPPEAEEKPNGSVLLAQFCIKIFAADVQLSNKVLGSVMAQPAVGQIAFAVLVSFGIAAFAVKKFLNLSYIWPIVSSALVTGFVSVAYLKQNILEHLIQRWPASFFSHPAVSILPVQIVAFGTLGAIAGYWLAIRYNYWRKHG
jgi:hypothetical protein